MNASCGHNACLAQGALGGSFTFIEPFRSLLRLLSTTCSCAWDSVCAGQRPSYTTSYVVGSSLGNAGPAHIHSGGMQTSGGPRSEYSGTVNL